MLNRNGEEVLGLLAGGSDRIFAVAVLGLPGPKLSRFAGGNGTRIAIVSEVFDQPVTGTIEHVQRAGLEFLSTLRQVAIDELAEPGALTLLGKADRRESAVKRLVQRGEPATDLVARRVTADPGADQGFHLDLDGLSISLGHFAKADGSPLAVRVHKLDPPPAILFRAHTRHPFTLTSARSGRFAAGRQEARPLAKSSLPVADHTRLSLRSRSLRITAVAAHRSSDPVPDGRTAPTDEGETSQSRHTSAWTRGSVPKC
jgi:hypothetical protein